MWPEVALILGAYLFGALPVLFLMGKLKGVDLREQGDLHLALWNMMGPAIGGLGIAADVAKGVIVVLVAKALDFDIAVVGAAGMATVIGQMWPAYIKGTGEKGNSTGLAMAFALAFEPFLVAAAPPMLIGLGVRTIPRLLDPSQSLARRLKFGGAPSQSLPLGMAIGFAVLPLGTWLVQSEDTLPIALTFLALFISIMIRRLTADLKEDLKTATDVKRILINRLLYDRSYL